MRRTRLEIESESNGYTYYFTDNFNKPFIVIKGVAIQFKSRKTGADYGKAVSYIRFNKRLGIRIPDYLKRDARKALEGRVK